MGFSLSQGPFTYNRFDLNEGAKPDFLDVDGDKNKKETFKKALKDKKDCGCKDEKDCDCSDKKKEVKEGHQQIDELAPLAALAPVAGKLAAGLATKGATAGAAKAGGGIAKAASSSLGKKAISAGSNAIGNKVQDKMTPKDESVSITKEMVIEYLVNEGFASNEVSAEILHTHVSDKFLESIESDITSKL